MTLPEIHKTSRIILATPRAIFRILLDPETIPAWRSSKGMTARVEHFDPRPSGTYCFAFNYPENDRGCGTSSPHPDIINGHFIEILPDERIMEAIRFETGDPRYQATMTVTTTLESVRDGTKVTLTAQDVPPGISEADHRARMDWTLKMLANFIE